MGGRRGEGRAWRAYRAVLTVGREGLLLNEVRGTAAGRGRSETVGVESETRFPAETSEREKPTFNFDFQNAVRGVVYDNSGIDTDYARLLPASTNVPHRGFIVTGSTLSNSMHGSQYHSPSGAFSRLTQS